MSRTQPNPDADPVEFTLTLRPLPSDIPVYIRLRRVLKSLLRTYDFRCEYYTATPTPIQLGHRGPNATPTLSHATPPTDNGTPEAGSCSSVEATRVVDATGGMPDGHNVDMLCVQTVQSVKLVDASECRAS